MPGRTHLVAVSALVLAGAIVGRTAVQPTIAQTPPAAPNSDRAAATFQTQCAGCHGDGLAGARAASLLDDTWSFGGGDDSLARAIRDGRADAGMPAFGANLPDQQIRELVAMIRAAASRAKGRPATRATPVVDGTIASERERFRLKTLTDALETPWGLAVLPDGRVLVTERPGRLRILERDALREAPVSGVPAVWTRQDGGLFDVEAHPRFAENHWVYLSYAEPLGTDRSMTVIIRGRLEGNALTEVTTIAKWPEAFYGTPNIHYGSRFIFDGQGRLFFSIGDRGQAELAQNLASPFGKIHRVTDDGKPAAGNPFAARVGALPTIWSYGHRNPQGFAWHPVTGEMWETEHGPRGGDEVNVVTPGSNYGWPVVSNGILDGWVSQAVDRTATAETSRPGMVSPVTYYSPSPGISPLLFYTGAVFPGWRNELLVGMMRDEELRRLTIEGQRIVHQEVLFRGLGRVRDIAQAADGSLYIALATPGAVVSDTTPGRVVRLVPDRR